MIRGIGNDIIEISRIRASIQNHGLHFLNKVFTAREQEYCSRFNDSAPHYAGRFAAKEAVVKALGTGFIEGISWLDIEVRHTEAGAPYPLLSAALGERFPSAKILLSISHCREYATATAIYTEL